VQHDRSAQEALERLKERLGLWFPPVNLGIITVIMGALAFVNSVMVGWYFLRQQRHNSKRTSRLSAVVLVLAGLGLYGYEISQGVQLMIQPSDTGIVPVIATIIVAVYGLGLTRAWQLLGAQRYSILSTISMMRDLDEPVIGEEEAAGSAASTTTGVAVPPQPGPQP
jgi:ABC-type Fe3+-siderophore transport system permease subunit